MPGTRTLRGNSARGVSRGLGSLVLWSLALLAAPGCVQWNLGDSLTWLESEPKPQTPDTVLAVWTDATLSQPGKSTVRGFGGRVMFFAEGNDKKSVPVEGIVSVYAFDDDRSDQQSPAPEKKFVFPAENLGLYQSESSLGPSYSLWLPWDNAGGVQRRISLLTRFEDKTGKLVLSKTARVTLPGTLPAAPAGAAPHANVSASSQPQPITANLGRPMDVQQAGYFSAPSPAADGQIATPLAVSPGLPATPTTLSGSPLVGAGQSSATAAIEVAPGQARRLLSGSDTQSGNIRGGSMTPWAPLTISQQTIGGNAPASPANPGSAAAAAAAASVRPAESATDSRLARSPARAATATRPASALVRRQPHHAEWLHGLPPTPRSGWGTTAEESSARDVSPGR